MRLNGHIILATALISLAASGDAYAICAEDTDVTSMVTQQGPVWLYDFTVQNGCHSPIQPLLSDFYIPYFADAGIANITMPAVTNTAPVAWTYSIEPLNDLFQLGTGVIDFHAATPIGYDGYAGFTFTANYDGVKGPFAMNLSTGTLFGDPQIPASPDTIAALDRAAVPEPRLYGVTGLAIMVLLAVAWRRELRRTRFDRIQDSLM